MKAAVFDEDAIQEMAEAAAWYEQRSQGLGGDFRRSIEEAVSRIRENPPAGSQFRTSKVRCVLVRRFPYVIFYREDPQNIRIVAVAHGSRRPGYWKKRLNNPR